MCVTSNGTISNNLQRPLTNPKPPHFHQQTGTVRKWLNRSNLFITQASLGLSYTVLEGIQISPEITLHPSGTLSQTLDYKISQPHVILASGVNLGGRLVR